MKTYGPKRIIINEQAKNVMPLSESSLNQMMDHGKTGMVIISSQVSEIQRTDPNLDLTAEFEKSLGDNKVDSDAMYREMKDWLRKRNKAADKALLNDIKDAGYSYTPVFGGYKMQETGEESHEPSYVVYCYDREGNQRDFNELKAFALRMCLKYSQESVYVQAPGKPPVYLDYNGNQTNSKSSKDFKFNRGDETYFTTTKRDREGRQRFTADIVFESMYIQLRPGDSNENRRRRESGEYIL